MARHISRKSAPALSSPEAKCQIHPGGVWLVAYLDDLACLNHVHDSDEDHSICGPILFCCKSALDRFTTRFPDNEHNRVLAAGRESGRVLLRQTPVDQVISWLDAGIQVVNFVYCDPISQYGLSAAVLSGKQARLALTGEIPLDEFVSEATLVGVGYGSKFRN